MPRALEQPVAEDAADVRPEQARDDRDEPERDRRLRLRRAAGALEEGGDPRSEPAGGKGGRRIAEDREDVGAVREEGEVDADVWFDRTLTPEWARASRATCRVQLSSESADVRMGSYVSACTAITVEMYAGRKGWDVGQLEVDVDVAYENSVPTHFNVTLRPAAGLDDDQLDRLRVIAGKCPVHRALAHETSVTIVDRVETL